MTAQPSPDLPDSLQRQTKTAADGAPTLGAVLSDALMCSRFCPRDDTCDHDVTCDDLEDAEWERIAGVVAERVDAEMTADRNDWKARCEQAWGQLDQAQADLAAMTARAHTAEAVVDAGRRWLNAPSVEGDYSTEYELERAIVAHDGTGPLRPPASTLRPVQATVEGSDAGNPENSSGGAA